MNKSLLLAALVAVGLAACGKEEPKPAPAAPAAPKVEAAKPAEAPAAAPAADAAKPAEPAKDAAAPAAAESHSAIPGLDSEIAARLVDAGYESLEAMDEEDEERLARAADLSLDEAREVKRKIRRLISQERRGR